MSHASRGNRLEACGLRGAGTRGGPGEISRGGHAEQPHAGHDPLSRGDGDGGGEAPHDNHRVRRPRWAIRRPGRPARPGRPPAGWPATAPAPPARPAAPWPRTPSPPPPTRRRSARRVAPRQRPAATRRRPVPVPAWLACVSPASRPIPRRPAATGHPRPVAAAAGVRGARPGERQQRAQFPVLLRVQPAVLHARGDQGAVLGVGHRVVAGGQMGA